MKYGNITKPSVDILKEIKTVHGLGFDYVELGLEGPEGDVRLIEKKKNQIKQLLKKFPEPAVTHTAWWMELGCPVEDIRRAWLEEFKKVIRVSAKLGIHVVNTHSHSAGMFVIDEKKHKLIVQKNFVKSLREAVRYAKKFNSVVVLENAGEQSEISRFKDFKYIADRVPGLKVHLDVGHAFIHGGMPAVKNFAYAFHGKIEHVHIHDNHGKMDEHLSLGRGNINFRQVVRILKETGYDKTMTFEIFTKNRKDTVRSREYFKKLWVKS